MAEDLKHYLQEHTCQGFRPIPHYSAIGDCVTYYFRAERCYAERVDELLTIYLALGTKELVGCKIEGVKHILETAGTFGVAIRDGTVHLGLFFFLGAMRATEAAQRSRYEELGRLAGATTLDATRLQSA